MASDLQDNVQSATASYEFEGLEVTEFDGDTLRKLLEEEEEEAEERLQDNIDDAITECMDSGAEDPHSMITDSEKIEPCCDGFAWIDNIEFEPALPSNDMNFWYIDTHPEDIISLTAELGNNIDNYQFYNAVQIHEVIYFGLWQDNEYISPYPM